MPDRPARPARSKNSARSSTIGAARIESRSEEHTSELQSRLHLVCRLLLEKKKKIRLKIQRVQIDRHSSRLHRKPPPHNTHLQDFHSRRNRHLYNSKNTYRTTPIIITSETR